MLSTYFYPDGYNFNFNVMKFLTYINFFRQIHNNIIIELSLKLPKYMFRKISSSRDDGNLIGIILLEVLILVDFR